MTATRRGRGPDKTPRKKPTRAPRKKATRAPRRGTRQASTLELRARLAAARDAGGWYVPETCTEHRTCVRYLAAGEVERGTYFDEVTRRTRAHYRAVSPS